MKVKSLADIKSVDAYLRRIGAEPRSMRTAVVKESHGAYWKDVAIIRLDKDGKIHVSAHDGQAVQEAFKPTAAEEATIKADCASVTWPSIHKVKRIVNEPEPLKHAADKDKFIFRDEDENIIMIQQRIADRDGGKAYVPWTYWDDGEWRRMEPEGRLPLWGIDQLKDFTTVFIHEGAKAARACAEMIAARTEDQAKLLAAHPWGEELSNAAHLGWIGGALSPARTDWSVLKRMGVKRVYVVSDNDEPGVAAVPAIAYHLRLPTFHVQFTNDWPPSFDLADAFPKKMFKKVDKAEHYVGPSFRSCIHPATWATDLIPQPKGRPVTVLRDEFKSMWAYVEEADMFVCIEMPEILRTEAVMNKMLAGFSHSSNTSNLMMKSYRGRATKLCYRPDLKGRVVTDKTTSAINLHTPTTIKSMKGDPSPWIEFLEYMFPVQEEREAVERWCATLIARPEVRMEYGLLLISETQGVGKTTLGAKILAPLVGDQNSGFPTEDDIVNSNFNGWLAHKRLIIIGEIYSGHSWKAYNKLKSYITDKDIEVNQKYMRPYRVENWAHILASSNSRKALKMEAEDRRWFYPRVTETPWPRSKFAALNEWLASGGLQIVKWWCEQYGDYVVPGERAPMTGLKKEMIEASRSDHQQEVADLCEGLKRSNEVVTIAMKEMVSWLKAKSAGKIFDSDYDLRKVAQEYSFRTYEKRLKIGAQMQHVMLSPAFCDQFRADLEGDSDDRSISNLIRKYLKHPGELISSDM